MTSLYQNKAMDNNSVVNGIEKLDQKRQSKPLPSHNLNMAKPSNCGKVLKTNLPSQYSNVINGTGNDSLYGKNDLYEEIKQIIRSQTPKLNKWCAVNRLNVGW